MNIVQTDGRGDVGHRHVLACPAWRRFLPDVPALDDFAAAAWVQAYDAAWLGQDWQRLARYLATDVSFVPNDSGTALIGRNATVSHLRAFLARSEVHEYNATDVRARVARGVGFISYRWQLDWSDTGRRRIADGRDLLSLRFVDGGWRMFWRLHFQP